MIRLWRFIARIGRRVWPTVPVAIWKWVGGCVLFVAVLLVLIPVLQVVSEWQVRRAGVNSAVVNHEAKTTPAEVASLENENRKTDLQLLGGAFAVIALCLTFWRVWIAGQGHITDRYTKAIEQLGAIKAEKDGNKPNVEVRLGAIYALERIAQDSPRDHWTIMEVLTAYVRQNAPAPAQEPTEEENKKAIAKGPATEIQAILTVLGRRLRDHRRESKGQRLDLRGSDLRGASLEDAHLDGTDFKGAHLDGAYFGDAHLDGTDFKGAHLDGAIFVTAHLDGAWFYGAHLDKAFFGGAHLKRASFYEAHLEGARFGGAHLEEADFGKAQVGGANFWCVVGLTVEHFGSAKGWEEAQFDDAFLQELRTDNAKRQSAGGHLRA